MRICWGCFDAAVAVAGFAALRWGVFFLSLKAMRGWVSLHAPSLLKKKKINVIIAHQQSAITGRFG